MNKWPDDVVNRLKCWWDNRETRCGETHVNCRDCPFHVPGYSMQDAVKDAIGWFYRLEAAQPKWISVEERLPVVGEVVLVSAKGRTSENTTPHDALTFASYWGDEGWIVDFLDDWNEIIVTHWMPLPQAPEVEKDD